MTAISRFLCPYRPITTCNQLNCRDMSLACESTPYFTITTDRHNSFGTIRSHMPKACPYNVVVISGNARLVKRKIFAEERQCGVYWRKKTYICGTTDAQKGICATLRNINLHVPQYCPTEGVNLHHTEKDKSKKTQYRHGSTQKSPHKESLRQA